MANPSKTNVYTSFCFISQEAKLEFRRPVWFILLNRRVDFHSRGI